jgi:DNA-binding SARP family transcriptional activator
MWRLHKSAPGLITVSDGALSLADDVSVDTRDLRNWARRVLSPRADEVELTVPDVGLRGELLPGWYDDWLLLERERFQQLRMHTLEVVAMRLMSVGRFNEALQAALAAVSAEPLRESAHRTVVRVHLAEGNIAEAVRAFHLFRAMLEKDLGVEPTEQMVGLIRGLSGRPSSPSDQRRVWDRPAR